MSRRNIGAVFCLIAAILYSTRFLTAAIFGSGISSWNSQLFNAMLSYVGDELKTLSIVALIVGIVYLIWAEFDRK